MTTDVGLRRCPQVRCCAAARPFTTAATLWLNAAVGVAAGADDDESSVDTPGLRRVTLFVQTQNGDGLAAAVTSFERRKEIVSLSVEPLAE